MSGEMGAAVAISVLFAILLAYILYLKKRDLDRAIGGIRQNSRQSVSKAASHPPPASKEMPTLKTNEIAITSPRDEKKSPKADSFINSSDGVSKKVADKKETGLKDPLNKMDVDGKSHTKVAATGKIIFPSMSMEIKSVQDYIQKKQLNNGSNVKNSFLEKLSLRPKKDDLSVTLKSHQPMAVPGYLQMNLASETDFQKNSEIVAGKGATGLIYSGRLKSPQLLTKHGDIAIAIKVFSSKFNRQAPPVEIKPYSLQPISVGTRSAIMGKIDEEPLSTVNGSKGGGSKVGSSNATSTNPSSTNPSNLISTNPTNPATNPTPFNPTNANIDAHADFLYEVAIMACIPPNPHVVSLIGYQENEPCAIVMPFYELNLKTLIHHDSFYLGPAVTEKIAIEVAKGLSFIHGRGVLHLDVKPQNVLVDLHAGSDAGGGGRTFHCLVCDFGYSSRIVPDGDVIRDEVRGLRMPNYVGLTWRYAAPELYEAIKKGGRLNREKDKKIDVYAFAITLYEVVTGMPPWIEASQTREIIASIKAGQRPNGHQKFLPEYEVNGDRAYLINLIDKCWAQDPGSRPSFDDIVGLVEKSRETRGKDINREGSEPRINLNPY